MKLVSPIGYATDESVDYLKRDEILNLYKDVAKYALDIKFENINLLNLINLSMSPKEQCNGYGKILSIYPNGDIFMCHSLADDEYKVGNIKNQSIEEVKHNLSIKLNNKEIKKLFSVNEMDICKDCCVKFFCTGFCAAEKNSCENIERLSVSCEIKKLLIKFELFYYDNKEDITYNLNTFLNYLNNYIDEKYTINAL